MLLSNMKYWSWLAAFSVSLLMWAELIWLVVS
ncbi:small membrane protein YmiC [Citrobacter sp. RHB25-C09]|nr:small membrane protein YmiC [Citrobacter sp. RHB25-C09]